MQMPWLYVKRDLNSLYCQITVIFKFLHFFQFSTPYATADIPPVYLNRGATVI